MPASRPSIPDRKRLDSDVRAFMRQPSTPWITFDRDSRVAQGEAPAPLVYQAAMFPSTQAAQPVVEPSNLVVASDLVSPFEEEQPYPEPRGGRRWIWGVAASVAVLAMAFVIAELGPSSSASSSKRAAAARAPVPTEAPPPDLAPPPPPQATTAEPTPPTPPRYPPNDPRAKLGRLSIRGNASMDTFFFDGKRMVGHGTRAFDVMCGAHTIAIGRRDAARSIDVPCQGELVVEK
jgi:hypothetical protein